MSDAVKLRAGRQSDVAAILDLWDGRIAWMVERGQAEQWGSEPASTRTPEIVQQWTENRGLTVAELDGDVVGVTVLTGRRPEYVQAIKQPESYVAFLLSSRDRIGCSIGSQLVRHDAAEARASGSEVLRVDCWAGAPSLVRWYERQGFARSDTFVVDDGWHGQVFEMRL